METTIAAWEQHLLRSSKLSANSITEYIQDVRRFAAWLRDEDRMAPISDLTLGDAKDYRDALLARTLAPATINRALTSLALFYDASGRTGDNPFRQLDRVDLVEHAPQALKHSAWNAVRRAAEQASRRDHGLALALVCLMRYAGLRVGEVAALMGPDLVISPRRGTVIVRRGKGLKHREIPLVVEARDPLLHYQDHRRLLAERWAARALVRHQTPPAWSCWPEGRVFLGRYCQLNPQTKKWVCRAREICIIEEVPPAFWSTRSPSLLPLSCSKPQTVPAWRHGSVVPRGDGGADKSGRESAPARQGTVGHGPLI